MSEVTTDINAQDEKVKSVTETANKAISSDMNVTAEDRKKVAAIAKKPGSRAGRKSKKMKSVATMRARVLLKDRIREEIKKKMTINEFADQQDVRRQYMYKLLSKSDNIASLDQLLGYAEDLDLKISITIDSPSSDQVQQGS